MLSLCGFQMGEEGCSAASALLCCSDSLRSLDLSRNGLEHGRSGSAMVIAKALPRSSSLTQQPVWAFAVDLTWPLWLLLLPLLLLLLRLLRLRLKA